VVEGARLESVFRGNSNVGSNPTLSAIIESIGYVSSDPTSGLLGKCLHTLPSSPTRNSSIVADKLVIPRSRRANGLTPAGLM
jgi:hypothetical protein